MRVKLVLLMVPVLLVGCTIPFVDQDKGQVGWEQEGVFVSEDEVVEEALGDEVAGEIFMLDAENFTFGREEIRVKQGDKVVIEVTNIQGVHDFLIDEYEVDTGIIGEGQTVTVELVADQVGEFEYYCSVGNHRQQGMKGKLIVL